MKTHLRIALPRLRELSPESVVVFALMDRDCTILRAGELALTELAAAVPARKIQAVLHPADTVATRLVVPPLSGPRLDAAVDALVEPLTLSATESLAVGHGPREADGLACIAWTEREPLARAWRTLAEAGLQAVHFYPTSEVLAPEDGNRTDALGLPVDARWQYNAPAWSLSLPALRPAATGASRWSTPLYWGAAATLLWLVGLNLYAGQLSREASGLRSAMQRQVANAFPDIPVVVDPLKQAEQRRDSLRASQGEVSENDFIPLAQAAARLLPDTRNRVMLAHYQNDALKLVVENDDNATTSPDAGPMQQAAGMGLLLERNEEGWRLSRNGDADANASAGKNLPRTPTTAALRMRQGGNQQ